MLTHLLESNFQDVESDDNGSRAKYIPKQDAVCLVGNLQKIIFLVFFLMVKVMVLKDIVKLSYLDNCSKVCKWTRDILVQVSSNETSG